ncbi:MAG: hypothetical protein R3335_06470 [Anaerolineales bacterium]|nr:hypothetical protein [Anaerolineales bacterium]
MTSPTTTNTILQPPWLNIARTAWIIMAVLAVVLFLAEFAILWDEPLPSCTDPGAVCGPWQVSREDLETGATLGLPAEALRSIYLLTFIPPRIAFLAVGLLIFWRRSDDWMALLLSGMLVAFLVEGVQNLGAFMPLVSLIYATSVAAFMLLPFIFPNGRFAPGWIGWVALPLAILGIGAQYTPALGIATSDVAFAAFLTGVFLTYFVAGAYSVTYRYRRISSPIERQQTKWVMAGILGTIILFIPFSIVASLFPPSEPSTGRLAFMFLVWTPIYILSYLLIPLSVAVAILRFRLWEIDVIIRKTLVYGALTASLALVYLGAVTLLQSLMSTISGQQSTAAIVISTLAIAALFTPLRRRIQRTIDRRFYRRRYDAARALAAFSFSLRDEVDPENLSRVLLDVVDEAIQPKSVSVWIKD